MITELELVGSKSKGSEEYDVQLISTARELVINAQGLLRLVPLIVPLNSQFKKTFLRRIEEDPKAHSIQ